MNTYISRQLTLHKNDRLLICSHKEPASVSLIIPGGDTYSIVFLPEHISIVTELLKELHSIKQSLETKENLYQLLDK